MSKGQICMTAQFRCSYMDIFEPKVWEEGEDGEYQVTMLFDDKKDAEGIRAAIKKELAEEFGDKVPANITMPFKDGNDVVDNDGNVREGYADKIVLKATSKYKPVIIDQKRKAIDSADADRFQSGDYALAQVLCRTWEFAGKQGVKVYLKAIQLVKQGERFGGGGTDLSAFGDLPTDNSDDLFS